MLQKNTLLLWLALVTAIVVVGAVVLLQSQKTLNLANTGSTRSGTIVWADVTGITVQQRSDDATQYDLFLTQKTGDPVFYTTISNVYTDAAHWYEVHGETIYILKRVGKTTAPNWTDELWKIDSEKQQTKVASGQGLQFLVSPDNRYIAVALGSDMTVTDTKEKTDNAFAGTQLSLVSSDTITPQLLAWSNDGTNLWGYVDHTTEPNFFRLTLPTATVERFGYPDGTFNMQEAALNPNLGVLAYSTYPQFFDTDSDAAFRASQRDVTLWQYNIFTQKREQLATAKATMFQPVWKDDVTVSYNNPDGSGTLTKTISLDEHILALSQYKADATDASSLYQQCPNRQPAFETLLKNAESGTRMVMQLNGSLPIVMTPNTPKISTDTFLAYGQDPNAYCGVGIKAPLFATPDYLFWAEGSCGGANTDEECTKAADAIKAFQLAQQTPTEADPFSFVTPAGWTMQRGYFPVNAVLSGGPAKNLGLTSPGADAFSTTTIRASWFHFNPDASLVDVANVVFPNNAGGTILKRDPKATIGGKEAYFVLLDGKKSPEPYYQSSQWFVRSSRDTITMFTVGYPTRAIYDATNAAVQQFMQSITWNETTQ